MLWQVLWQKMRPIYKKKALQACIDCLPTDGSGICDSDTEQWRARNYEEVDDTLIEYLQGGSLMRNPTVIGRHLATEYKRRNPYCITRSMLGLEDF